MRSFRGGQQVRFPSALVFLFVGVVATAFLVTLAADVPRDRIRPPQFRYDCQPQYPPVDPIQAKPFHDVRGLCSPIAGLSPAAWSEWPDAVSCTARSLTSGTTLRYRAQGLQGRINTVHLDSEAGRPGTEPRRRMLRAVRHVAKRLKFPIEPQIERSILDADASAGDDAAREFVHRGAVLTVSVGSARTTDPVHMRISFRSPEMSWRCERQRAPPAAATIPPSALELDRARLTRLQKARFRDVAKLCGGFGSLPPSPWEAGSKTSGCGTNTILAGSNPTKLSYEARRSREEAAGLTFALEGDRLGPKARRRLLEAAITAGERMSAPIPPPVAEFVMSSEPPATRFTLNTVHTISNGVRVEATYRQGPARLEIVLSPNMPIPQ